MGLIYHLQQTKRRSQMSSERPFQSHRIAPLHILQPSEILFRLPKSQRFNQDENQNDLFQQIDSTDRYPLDDHSEYSHQIDAIFTELQDQLISVKNEFHYKIGKIAESKLLNPKLKASKMAQQIHHIRSLFTAFREIHRHFEDEQMRHFQHFKKDQMQIEESFNDRVTRRVSEALVDMSNDKDSFRK